MKRHTSGVSNFVNSASTRSLIPLRLSLTIVQILLPITSLVPHPITSLTLADATRKVPWDDNSAQNSRGTIDAAPSDFPGDASLSLEPEERNRTVIKNYKYSECSWKVTPAVIREPPWVSSPLRQPLPRLPALSTLPQRTTGIHRARPESIIAFRPFPGSTWSLPRHSSQTYGGAVSSDGSFEHNVPDDRDD